MDAEPLQIGDPHGNGTPGGVPAVRMEPSDREPEETVAGLAAIVESLLLSAGAPVPVAKLAEALDGPGRAEIVRALDELGARYERTGSGLRVVRVAGGYQLRTAPEHAPWVRRLLRERPPRLSRAMLETVAVVAYRQPCTRLEIEAVRGVDVDAVLSTLLERRLVRVLGRKDTPGRPLLYGTTREFLEVFGLPDLDALPTLPELGAAPDALAIPAPEAPQAPEAKEPEDDEGA